MAFDHLSATCGFCLRQAAGFCYRTVAVEMPTPDSGTFRDGEATWYVCSTCSDLVEARQWAKLAERVYAARAEATPPESREQVREAVRQMVDLFSSAALAPRRLLLDLGGGPAPVPSPQEVAAFTANLMAGREDEEGPELVDWDWVEEEIARAKAAGELQADWVVESDLSFIGEFFFALVRCRLNGEEGEVRILSFHEFEGAWAIFPELSGLEQEELELGPGDILAVIKRAEDIVRDAGAEYMDTFQGGTSDDAD